jgi:hypothetical protein
MHLCSSSFSWASTVTACNPRSHDISVWSSTLALTKLFSFGKDPAFHWMCLAHFFKPGTIPSSTNHDCVRDTHFSIMISSATHSQQLISVVVFIVVLWLLFIEQCYSPRQSCWTINMQRLSFLGLFRLLRSIMTIHFVSVIKHYIPFNYIHHTQHLFKSPRSVCHGVLLMARAIQARTLLSTST